MQVNKNFFRSSIAGIVLSGGLLAGTAGIAAAETGSTTTPERPSTEQVCQRASTAWQRLLTLDEKLHEHYQKVVALRDKAAAEGKTELAAKLTQRLERVKERHLRVEAKLKEIHAKGAAKCNIPEPVTTDLA
jgi:tryptophanyl-tRNA synthetase